MSLLFLHVPTAHAVTVQRQTLHNLHIPVENLSETKDSVHQSVNELASPSLKFIDFLIVHRLGGGGALK